MVRGPARPTATLVLVKDAREGTSGNACMSTSRGRCPLRSSRVTDARFAFRPRPFSPPNSTGEVGREGVGVTEEGAGVGEGDAAGGRAGAGEGARARAGVGAGAGASCRSACMVTPVVAFACAPCCVCPCPCV